MDPQPDDAALGAWLAGVERRGRGRQVLRRVHSGVKVSPRVQIARRWPSLHLATPAQAPASLSLACLHRVISVRADLRPGDCLSMRRANTEGRSAIARATTRREGFVGGTACCLCQRFRCGLGFTRRFTELIALVHVFVGLCHPWQTLWQLPRQMAVLSLRLPRLQSVQWSLCHGRRTCASTPFHPRHSRSRRPVPAVITSLSRRRSIGRMHTAAWTRRHSRSSHQAQSQRVNEQRTQLIISRWSSALHRQRNSQLGRKPLQPSRWSRRTSTSCARHSRYRRCSWSLRRRSSG